MKNRVILLVVFIFQCIGNANAQFPSFPDSNAFWLMHVHDGPEFLYAYGYHLRANHHDTLINDNWYNTLWGGMIGQSGAYYGGLREDTASRVYYYHPEADSEYLLYDFNPMVEETLFVWVGDPEWSGSPPLQMMVVGSVDLEVNAIGMPYKRIGIMSESALSGGQGVTQYWIQGVGGTGGLFNTIGSLTVSLSIDLSCMQHNDTIWPYGSPGICWPTALMEHEIAAPVVHPNPSTGPFTLSGSTNFEHVRI